MCNDFENFVREIGVTIEAMNKARLISFIPMTEDVVDKIWVGNSEIHGYGLIARTDIQAGESFLAMVGKKQFTEIGRFCNHSPAPNVVPVDKNGDVYVEAIRLIKAGEELTASYRSVMKVVLKLE